MSKLTEHKKLIMLGIKQPTQSQSSGSQVTTQLANIFGSFGDFKTAFQAATISSFAGFEQFLKANDDPEASDTVPKAIRDTAEDNFDTFADFENAVSNADTKRELQVEFSINNSFEGGLPDGDGGSAAGLQVYDTAGVGRNGQSIPAGGVEVFGDEVHFSQTNANPDDGGGGDKDPETGTGYEFSYSGLSFESTILDTGEMTTVQATVQEPANRGRSEAVQLFEDGTVIETEYVQLGPGESTTVIFEYRNQQVGVYDVGIGPLGPTPVSVTLPGITPI